jgi:hypothetical protein
MPASSRSEWGTGLAAIVLGAWITTAASAASAASLESNPVAGAVKRGDCDAAIDLVKNGVASNDSQAVLLGGRMLDEGVCVVQNPGAAAQFFEIAAKLGDREAALEYAAKVGLGQGVEQSYEHAGELCRAAGVDSQGRLSGYSLGYACTVRSVAGRLLRVTLPAGAFRPGTGVAVVEFKPSDSTIRVLSTPQAERESDARTGSNLRKPLVDARGKIEGAWRKALAEVPKPEAARLQDQPVELSLDAETALENGAPGQRSLGAGSLDLPPSVTFVTKPPARGH